MIYTHSHVDHFGGVLGVVDADTDVPIVAPERFLEHAVSENVYAGDGDAAPRHVLHRRRRCWTRRRPAGRRRAGPGRLDRHGRADRARPWTSPTPGRRRPSTASGSSSSSRPGTEAPAEMNFYFPDRRALCLAENATHNLHNLLTLRGARGPRPAVWSRYLAEAIELFADDADVAFASHHWPTWGTREHRRGSSPSSATSTPTCTTRPCGCSTRVWSAREIAETDRAAARAGRGLAHPRLLRLGQPQRQGDLPALPRLVRRQPRAPVAAPAGGGRRSATSRSSAASTPTVGQGAGVRRPTATSASPPSCATHAVFADPDHDDAQDAARRRPHAARLRVGVRDLAQLLPDRRPGTAARRRADRRHRGRGDGPGDDRHPALRLPRHPRRRAEGVGASAVDPLALHRHRRDATGWS